MQVDLLALHFLVHFTKPLDHSHLIFDPAVLTISLLLLYDQAIRDQRVIELQAEAGRVREIRAMLTVIQEEAPQGLSNVSLT